MKDNTNQTLLQYICKKIAEQDEEFHEGAKKLVASVTIKDVDTAYLKTKTGELTALYAQVRASFALVTGGGEPFDRFMEVFEVLLNEANQDLERIKRQLKEVQDKHLFMTGYFGIEKNSELNDKSEEFFKIF